VEEEGSKRDGEEREIKIQFVFFSIQKKNKLA